MHLRKLVSAALIATVFAATPALAQDAGTLKKIKDSGAITMGVRESSGLSYTIGDGKYVGYHIDVCEHVVADLRPAVTAHRRDMHE